jgi:hypothetical protein
MFIERVSKLMGAACNVGWNEWLVPNIMNTNSRVRCMREKESRSKAHASSLMHHLCSKNPGVLWRPHNRGGLVVVASFYVEDLTLDGGFMAV